MLAGATARHRKIAVVVLKTQESCFKSIGVGTECRGARLGGDQKSRHVNEEGLAEIYRRPPAH